MRGLAILAALLPLAALAHGDAAWISSEPRYVDRNKIHCCGVADCRKVERSAVTRILEGWRLVDTGRVFRDGDPDLYDSIDDDIWLCRREGTDRCLFVPALGV